MDIIDKHRWESAEKDRALEGLAQKFANKVTDAPYDLFEAGPDAVKTQTFKSAGNEAEAANSAEEKKENAAENTAAAAEEKKIDPEVQK